MYRKKARQVYLSIVKRKKKAKKWLQSQIRKMLNFLKRDIKYLSNFIEKDVVLCERHATWWVTIQKIYEQQQYMYDHNTHSVSDRIVSFHQPWLRPIVRWKAKDSVEFGAKFDMGMDNGICRVEKISFNPYNESEVLVSAIRHYYDRHGYYPKPVLADKIYRNRMNIHYFKQRGIRLSGPYLGRPKKGEIRDKAIDYKDNADRVEVERGFRHLKRAFGLDLLRTKRQDTTKSAILLSIIAKNLSTFVAASFGFFLDWFIFFFKVNSKISTFQLYENMEIIQ